MTTRYYSSVATPKTLSVTINAGATSMTLSDAVGLPTSYPFTLAVNFGDVNEELVDVTNAAGTTMTITRGVDGTTATSHTAGAVVRHVASGRDHADSRTHENSTSQVHGLGVGDDLVGTVKVQSLSNKTLVNATGTLQNIDINSSDTHVIDIVKTPAGVDSNTAIRLMSNADEVLNVSNGGRLRIQNLPSYDALNTNRRFQITLSNGTTEVFYVNTSGMVVSAPRAGSLASQSGFKVIIPDATDRAAFQVRDPADTTDRFNVHAAGHVDINGTDASSSQLDVKGASGQTASFMRVQDFSGVNQWSVDVNGRMVAAKRAQIQNAFDVSSVVLSVEGFSPGQTGDLQRWLDGSGSTAARVKSDGQAEFTALTASSGVFTVGSGWSLTSQAVAVRAGIVTINVTVTRTGGDIVAAADGNISDTSMGTVAAAYRPNTIYGSQSLVTTATNGFGTGGVRLNASTGDTTLVSWNSAATLQNGTGVQLTYTYVGL